MKEIKKLTRDFRNKLRQDNINNIREATLDALSESNRAKLASRLSTAFPEYFDYEEVLGGDFIACDVNSKYNPQRLDNTVVPKDIKFSAGYVVGELAFSLGLSKDLLESCILILTSKGYRDVKTSAESCPNILLSKTKIPSLTVEASPQCKLLFTSKVEHCLEEEKKLAAKCDTINSLPLGIPHYFCYTKGDG